jgi:NTP pyrophosphatase (non-canonical NTP hydrolase)
MLDGKPYCGQCGRDCYTCGEQNPVVITAADYQEQAARTLITNRAVSDYPGEQIRLVWNALGLAGEAGEVADVVKKAVFHEHPLDQATLIKELGDVLWYVAALCSVLNIDLGDVMQANIDKLKARYPEGWDAQRSQQRGA